MSRHPFFAREQARDAVAVAVPPPVQRPLAAPAAAVAGMAGREPPSPAAGFVEARLDPLQRLAFFLLTLFVFVLYSRVFDIVLSGLHLPLFIACATMMLAALTGEWRAFVRLRVFHFLLAFTVWLVIASPFGVWPTGSLVLLRDQWSRAIAFFVLLASLLSSTRLSASMMRTVGWALLVCGAVAQVSGEYTEGRLKMATGHFSNPNDLGGIMMMGAILWWSASSDRTRSIYFRLFSVGCVFFMLAVASQTGSRMAMIVGACILPMLLVRYSLAGRLVFLGGASLAMVGILVVVPNSTLRRFVTFFEAAQVETVEDSVSFEKATASANQRLMLLLTSLRVTAENPVLGVGPGMFVVAQNDLALDAGFRGIWLGTHNTYTEISSEAGIPALIFFLGAMVTCWRQLGALRRRNRGMPHHPLNGEIDLASHTLRILLVACAVQFMFSHVAYSTMFPTIAGLVVGLTRGANRDLDQAAAGG